MSNKWIDHVDLVRKYMLCMYRDTLAPRTAAQNDMMITGLDSTYEDTLVNSLISSFEERGEYFGTGPGRLKQKEFNNNLAEKCQSTFSSALVRR